MPEGPGRGRHPGRGIRPACRAAAWLIAACSFFACLPAAAEEWRYPIRPGDTLWDLAGEYLRPGFSWQALQAHNAIADPYRLVPGTALRFPLDWLRTRPAQARVVSVHGAATVRPAEGAGARPVEAGMELDRGAVLRTPAGANLTLEFADGSRLQMLGDSELHLDRLSLYGRNGRADTRLRLPQGRLRNRVDHGPDGGASFIVDTPRATSSVRGTRFRIGTDDEHSRTEVLEGTVDVRSHGRDTRVRAGYGALVAGAARHDAPLRPLPLLPAPAPPPLPDAPLAPGDALHWPAMAEASAYRVQIATQPEFGEVLLDTLSAEARLPVPTLPEGRYHLRLSAVDARGLAGAETVAAFDLTVPPAPPYSIAPEQDAVAHTDRPEFQWSRNAQAAGYRFQLAGDAGFGAPLQSLRTRTTRHRPPQALPPGTYWWRVASDGADGCEGPYGDPVRFVVRPPPGEIALDAGGDARDADTPAGAVTFRWQSGGDGLRYRFQMSRSPDFARLPVDVTVDQPQVTLPRLGAGTWYLRAWTVDAQGREGPPPPTQSVRVPCRLCQALVGGGALLILLAL